MVEFLRFITHFSLPFHVELPVFISFILSAVFLWLCTPTVNSFVFLNQFIAYWGRVDECAPLKYMISPNTQPHSLPSSISAYRICDKVNGFYESISLRNLHEKIFPCVLKNNQDEWSNNTVCFAYKNDLKEGNYTLIEERIEKWMS